MKKSEVLAYLDELVEVYKDFHKIRNKKGTEGITFCREEDIHVYTGIHVLAAAADISLKRESFKLLDDSQSYAFRYLFTYKNVELFQLSNEEGFPEVVWDE